MDMMKDNIFIFPTKADAAEALAEFIVRDIAATIQNKGIYTIALSGGNTPKSLFGILADKYTTSIDWSLVRFFWVDERCVPPSDPESNYRMANETFLGKLQIRSKGIHRIYGENEPSEEVQRYSEEISNSVAFQNGLPSSG